MSHPTMSLGSSHDGTINRSISLQIETLSTAERLRNVSLKTVWQGKAMHSSAHRSGSEPSLSTSQPVNKLQPSTKRSKSDVKSIWSISYRCSRTKRYFSRRPNDPRGSLRL